MILRVYILHKLDSCQGKMYKKHAEVMYFLEVRETAVF